MTPPSATPRTDALISNGRISEIEEVRKLERELAEAKAWTDEDKSIPEDVAIAACHPTATGDHETYQTAMRLVGAKRSKFALVDLVNWLLERVKRGEALRQSFSEVQTLADERGEVCGEAYQAAAILAVEAGRVGERDVEKPLDNLSDNAMTHKDVLPFKSIPTRLEELERENERLSINAVAWIPVSERKPEDGVTVLGYWPATRWSPMSFESLTFHAQDEPESRDVWESYDGSVSDEPCHWTPLPEAPK